MVIVGVAGLQEGRNAVLQTDKRGTNREELVPGDGAVRVPVQIAPFPDGGIGPATGHVGLRLQLHLHVVLGELVPLREVAHHIEEPVAHAPREVLHVLLQALALLVTLAVVVDVQVAVDGRQAPGGLRVAQAALLVDGAIRGPRLIRVGADASSQVRLLGALRDADAFGLHALQLADPAGSTMHLLAGIN